LRTTRNRDDIEVNTDAGVNGRRGDELRRDVGPERSRPVTDQAVQRVGIGAGRRRRYSVGRGVMLDDDRPASSVVAVVLMR